MALQALKQELNGLNSDVIAQLAKTDPKALTQIQQAILDNLTQARQKFVAILPDDIINFESRVGELETQYLQLGGSRHVLDSLNRGENALLLGGDYALVGKQNEWRVVNHEGQLVEAASGYKVIEIQGQQICIIRSITGNDYSAATLPGATTALIVGDRYHNVIRNQYNNEIKKGYRQNESLKMIIGHELTHIRFHGLGDEARRSITDFFSRNWGQIHSFAQILLSRPDYRTHVLKFSQKAIHEDPNTKTRPVIINNETYDVAVEAVIDELLAYYSGIELLGEARMRELAEKNPTGEHPSRESLSVKALECVHTVTHFDNAKKSFDRDTSSLYRNLESDSDTVITETKRLLLQ